MAGKGAFYSLPRPTYNAQILAQKGVWGELAKAKSQECCTAKVDVTFGDDVDGIGGKAGMRVSW